MRSIKGERKAYFFDRSSRTPPWWLPARQQKSVEQGKEEQEQR